MTEDVNHQLELEKDDIRCIMKTEGGRRFIHKMLARADVMVDIFSPDPYTNAYHMGRRAYGVNLLNLVRDYAPESYIQMLKEHLDE